MMPRRLVGGTRVSTITRGMLVGGREIQRKRDREFEMDFF